MVGGSKGNQGSFLSFVQYSRRAVSSQKAKRLNGVFCLLIPRRAVTNDQSAGEVQYRTEQLGLPLLRTDAVSGDAIAMSWQTMFGLFQHKPARSLVIGSRGRR
jgi:hypothetical protein